MCQVILLLIICFDSWQAGPRCLYKVFLMLLSYLTSCVHINSYGLDLTNAVSDDCIIIRFVAV